MFLLVSKLIILNLLLCSFANANLSSEEWKGSQPNNSNAWPFNKFAFAVANELAAKNENFFISPLGISSALLMAYYGANDVTREQLKSLLKLDSLRDDQILALYRSQLELFKENSVTLNMANAMFTSSECTLNPTFKQILKLNFDSNLQQLNFADQRASVRFINDWVADKTNAQITNLVSPSSLDPLTKIMLLNAIYFKGTWKKEFDRTNSKMADFYLSQGNTTKVELMRMDNVLLNCRFNPEELTNVDVCELPYRADKISMLLILPTKSLDTRQVESRLDGELFDRILRNLSLNLVNLQLPKFKIEFGAQLKAHLIQMSAGVKTAFSPMANFNSITKEPNDFYLSSVVHQAVVEVNEQGTEAAAATKISIKKRSHLNFARNFICNRPFLIVIYEKTTSNVLFVGKISRP